MSDDELIDVELLQLPLDVLARAQERSAELSREFSHIAATHSGSVPARLEALSQHLRGQYGGHVTPAQAAIDAAMDRGDATIDVTFRIPRSAGAASEGLLELLAESDEFCQSGDLLTLATPPDLIAFRYWYLGQFISQSAGGEPVPWPAFDHTTAG